MAEQKDHGTNPPAENPTLLLLKKKAMASLVGANRLTELDSDEDLMDSSKEEVEKPNLQEVQRKAYYSVLEAFAFETSTISKKVTEITEQLKNEWQIAGQTHISFAAKIQKDLLTLKESDKSSLSDKKGRQRDHQEKPSPKSASPSSTCVPRSCSSWESFNPESLNGKWVRIRLSKEAAFEEFLIKEFDAKQDMHRLVTANSNAMETDVDPTSTFFDLRKISSEDIMWESGEKPNFHAPNKSTAQRVLF